MHNESLARACLVADDAVGASANLNSAVGAQDTGEPVCAVLKAKDLIKGDVDTIVDDIPRMLRELEAADAVCSAHKYDEFSACWTGVNDLFFYSKDVLEQRILDRKLQASVLSTGTSHLHALSRMLR